MWGLWGCEGGYGGVQSFDMEKMIAVLWGFMLYLRKQEKLNYERKIIERTTVARSIG